MKTLLLVMTMATALMAADQDFNGRWDITAPATPKRSAWWMEVSGAGTAAVKGRFTGFPGGDTNDMQNVRIENGVLYFGFERGGNYPWKGTFTAKLVDGKLVGERESSNEPKHMTWTGVRAPEIADKEDGTWVKAKPVKLFDGKSLKGWQSRGGEEAKGWTVKDGLLQSTGHVQDLVSKRNFWNFELHVEYRVAPHSNSGLGLRGRYEVQILEDYGQAPNTHGSGSLYSRIQPTENATKPANEWNTYDIRLVGRTVTVVMNGRKVIDAREIEGLTAIAYDANEGEPGPFVLQGDHGPVDFRSVVVTPLVKKK
jgi:hypothetical protein